MKKVFKSACFFLTILSAMIVAQDTPDQASLEEHPVLGGWNRRGFYYVFDNNGVMKAVKVDGSPIGYRQYKYRMFKMGVNEFIEYGRGKKEIDLRYILLVDDIRDSTSIIALSVSISSRG